MSAKRKAQRHLDDTLQLMSGIPTLPMVNVGGLDSDALGLLGLAQDQQRRRESTGSLSSKYWLSLLPQPPRYPHARSYFPLKVVLVDSKKNLKPGWNVMLHVELLYENGELVPDQKRHLEVYGHDESRPIILNASGSVDLKVRVLTTSMAHENKPFFLRFSGVAADKNIPNYVTFMPATSTLLTVIRHRLRITEPPPSLWYKDEGGRDKCISINGLLVDEHEQAVQGREVPLKVLLCYEGEDCHEVKNQGILKMPTDSLPKVDKFGRVALKVRIEEVSKNHQKQAFVIKIAPDTVFSAENADISPDISSAVTVLSKRNKRRPKGDRADDDSPEGPTPVQGMPYSGGMFSLAPAAAAAATMPAAFPKVAPVPTINAQLASASSSVLPSITPSGTQAKPQTLANTSLTGANMTRITSTDGSSLILNDSSEYKPAPSPTFSDTISHLVNWAQHVHDLLTKIEWQHVGFEVQEDGQMNLHRPLYRCPGCWAYQDTIRQTGHRDSCKISKLSSAYRTHVHVYLSDLLGMATNGAGAGQLNQMPPPSLSQSNPSNLASQNSLMAAYSKNTSGNLFLAHSNSQMAPRSNSLRMGGGNGTGHPSLQSQNSLVNGTGSMLTSQNSIMMPPRAASLNRANTSTQNTSAVKIDDDEPAAKKQKTSANTASGAQSSESLFPPPSDWANLAALDLPLSSPNALMDRGISALGPAALGDRGLSVLDSHGQMVGQSAFATLGAFQQDGGQNSDFMSDLPSDSLSLLRAGSSINIDTLMSDRADESTVDAIHVTATPFGFPAFSANTSSAPASLVGFYQYDESTSFLAFVPLAKFQQITPAQREAMEKIFRSLKEQESNQSNPQSRILTRQQCITLDKLKEEALLLHYASQAR